MSNISEQVFAGVQNRINHRKKPKGQGEIINLVINILLKSFESSGDQEFLHRADKLMRTIKSDRYKVKALMQIVGVSDDISFLSELVSVARQLPKMSRFLSLLEIAAATYPSSSLEEAYGSSEVDETTAYSLVKEVYDMFETDETIARSLLKPEYNIHCRYFIFVLTQMNFIEHAQNVKRKLESVNTEDDVFEKTNTGLSDYIDRHVQYFLCKNVLAHLRDYPERFSLEQIKMTLDQLFNSEFRARIYGKLLSSVREKAYQELCLQGIEEALKDEDCDINVSFHIMVDRYLFFLQTFEKKIDMVNEIDDAQHKLLQTQIIAIKTILIILDDPTIFDVRGFVLNPFLVSDEWSEKITLLKKNYAHLLARFDENKYREFVFTNEKIGKIDCLIQAIHIDVENGNLDRLELWLDCVDNPHDELRLNIEIFEHVDGVYALSEILDDIRKLRNREIAFQLLCRLYTLNKDTTILDAIHDQLDPQKVNISAPNLGNRLYELALITGNTQYLEKASKVADDMTDNYAAALLTKIFIALRSDQFSS